MDGWGGVGGAQCTQDTGPRHNQPPACRPAATTCATSPLPTPPTPTPPPTHRLGATTCATCSSATAAPGRHSCWGCPWTPGEVLRPRPRPSPLHTLNPNPKPWTPAGPQGRGQGQGHATCTRALAATARAAAPAAAVEGAAAEWPRPRPAWEVGARAAWGRGACLCGKQHRSDLGLVSPAWTGGPVPVSPACSRGPVPASARRLPESPAIAAAQRPCRHFDRACSTIGCCGTHRHWNTTLPLNMCTISSCLRDSAPSNSSSSSTALPITPVGEQCPG